jgi:hypothetical protein
MGIVSFSPWNLRQINSPVGQKAGATDAPAAAGDPFASVFGSQRHIAYLDASGAIHDCWYDGARGRWNHQQINGADGATSGPPATGAPFVWSVGPQQHVTYRTADGVIYDCWYTAGRWNLQQINGEGGRTSGPAASANPFASVFGNQQHIAYLDAAGVVYDSWYEGDRWSLQQINGDGGLTRGSPAVGGPFIWTVGPGQQHFTYYDATGTIHDSWFAGGNWNLQHINGAGGLTDGPAAAGLPFVSVYEDQQHFFYLGRTTFALAVTGPIRPTGIIHDAWFDGTKKLWNLRQINGAGGVTSGPEAVAGPSASVFTPPGPQAGPPGPRAGQHVGYRDSAGTIYDCWFDSRVTGWHRQQVTGAGGATEGPVAAGGPFVWTVGAEQQHFIYRTAAGTIYDAWFNAVAPAG